MVLKRIFTFFLVLVIICSSTSSVFASVELSEDEIRQIEIIRQEIKQIQKEKSEWDKSFSGDLNTEEGIKRYFEEIGVFEKQISDKLNTILEIEGNSYSVVPGTNLAISSKGEILGQKHNGLLIVPCLLFLLLVVVLKLGVKNYK